MYSLCRDGCENAFLLHVSLHPVSRKMLIQLMEGNSQGNVRSLGLLPGNYVTDDPEALRRRSWAGATLGQGRPSRIVSGIVCNCASHARGHQSAHLPRN